MIYFVTYENMPGYVKIGYSDNQKSLDDRLANYVTYNPTPLKVLKIIEGTREDEKRIHSHLKHSKAANEWFYLTNEVRNYLGDADPIKDSKREHSSPSMKYLHQRRPNQTFVFHRRVPAELIKYNNYKQQWWIPLSANRAEAEKLCQQHTKRTDAWIAAHMKLVS